MNYGLVLLVAWWVMIAFFVFAIALAPVPVLAAKLAYEGLTIFGGAIIQWVVTNW